MPRWEDAVVRPISEAIDPNVNLAVGGYIMFATLVAIHALCFWKVRVLERSLVPGESKPTHVCWRSPLLRVSTCVGMHVRKQALHRVGTVATAVSKGAQQSGVFIFA